jgi:hypothetical protein
MRHKLFRYAILWALASLLLYASAAGTSAGWFTRGCAARDLQVLMLIEERESTSSAAQDRLSEAMLTMMHARNVCYAGRVAEALALYDDISRSLTTNAVLSGRMQ